MAFACKAGRPRRRHPGDFMFVKVRQMTRNFVAMNRHFPFG
jgi:hypothetical protein